LKEDSIYALKIIQNKGKTPKTGDGDRFWYWRLVIAKKEAETFGHRGNRRAIEPAPLWVPKLPVSFWTVSYFQRYQILSPFYCTIFFV